MTARALLLEVSLCQTPETSVFDEFDLFASSSFFFCFRLFAGVFQFLSLSLALTVIYLRMQKRRGNGVFIFFRKCRARLPHSGARARVVRLLGSH